MTERPLSITTQIATPIQTVFSSATSTSANDALPVNESVEEEPYTIKCICDFSDDDGNTIYCETCDTWQHIECYYPGRVDDASREEFDHSCADCKPRTLDSRHATERQRHQRQNKAINDPGDKKSKRPPSKSHKKKVKPSDVQVNGYHEHDGHKNGSPQDHHPHTKKSKGHRSNQSISSQMKRSPPLNTRPHNHGHPPSPAHTPPDLPNNFQLHSYSDNFLSLYDDDQAAHSSTTNSFASLSVTNSMSLWLHDPEKLQEDAGVKDKDDVFQYLKVDVDTLKWPELRIERKEAKLNDTVLHWRSLITPTHLPQPGRIGELNGLVGFQKDYCSDAANRWTESAHPRPFIFFHPRLPLFIDTRQEGSRCRYVRRSCRANTTLETFIASGSEYHFWLISERQLPANEQITIPWDFRFPSHCRSRFLHLLNLGDEDGPPFDGADITDDEYEQLTTTIHLVLSDYGGCACDLANDCAFARFHRNYHGRAHSQSNGVKSKKGRKPKQNHVSPTSTGHATNSRAASEGQDPYDEDDSRSLSGSVRSKPHSRDLTPLHSVGETNGILTEPSDREKRKLAMLEDSFRKMEQQGQPARKKKRTSEGSNMNLPSTNTPQPPSKGRQRSVAPRGSISQPSALNTNGARSRQYVDASTSGRQSGSPFSAISPTAVVPSPNNHASRSNSIPYQSRPTSLAPRGVYIESSTQTDAVADAWWDPKPKPKRCIVPLAKRLLRNRHKIQAQLDVQTEIVMARQGAEELSLRASPAISMDLDPPTHEERCSTESPTDAKCRQACISSTPSVDVSSTDVSMTDAPAIMVGNTIKPPPPPWPGHLNSIATGSNPVPSQRSPDLRVQMPPALNFSGPNIPGTPSGPGTPSSSAASIAQSPFGTIHFPPNAFPPSMVNGVVPSPVKTTKKLSLSDYKARMKRTDTSTANKSSTGSSPTVAPAVLKPSLSTVEEVKASGVLEGSAIVDSLSPMLEKTTDPMASAGVATSDPAAQKNNMPSAPANGAL